MWTPKNVCDQVSLQKIWSLNCRPNGILDLKDVQPSTDALQAGTSLTEIAASGARLSPSDKLLAEDILIWPVVAQVQVFLLNIKFSLLTCQSWSKNQCTFSQN